MPPEVPTSPTPRARLREVATVFTRLGFTAFGGPAAHIALFEDELVNRRAWIDRQHFLDLVGMTNFVPGPNSTELAIHLGYLRAGWRGLIVAGICFILPAMIIILPLAWLYVKYGDVPQVRHLLVGVNACVIAIIAAALWRFGQTALKDPLTTCIAIAAAGAGLATHAVPHYQPELVILAISAIVGAIWYGNWRLPRRLPLLAITVLPSEPELARNLARMTLLFLKVGATLFGSGYLLVTYLQSGLVERHGWMTDEQLLTAITIGQFTPGPLLTTASFVGYVVGHTTFGGGVAGGIAGGVLATIAIFLPSFCFVALLAKMMDRLRQSTLARGALDGINAAVVALILVVTVNLARSALTDTLSIAIAAISLLVLLRWNINATWLILLAGIAGMVGQAAAAFT